jgi:hypothetical protein
MWRALICGVTIAACVAGCGGDRDKTQDEAKTGRGAGAVESVALDDEAVARIGRSLEAIAAAKPDRMNRFLIEIVAEELVTTPACDKELDRAPNLDAKDLGPLGRDAWAACRMACPDAATIEKIEGMKHPAAMEAITASCDRIGPDPFASAGIDRATFLPGRYVLTRGAIDLLSRALDAKATPEAKAVRAKLDAMLPRMAPALVYRPGED